MTTGSLAVNGIGARRGVLIMAMMLLTVLLLGPSGVSGAKKTLDECTDETWAGYNACLVKARSWLGRLNCDFSWELEVAECVAQEVGEVLKAADGKTNVPD